MLQQIVQGFGLVVVLLFFDGDEAVCITLPDPVRNGVHVTDDGIRKAAIREVPEESFRRAVAADDTIRTVQKIERIGFPWEFAGGEYDGFTFHSRGL